MSRVKTHVRKGDEVEVITGAHKGARGKVLAVMPAKGHLLVEGVRMIKKHQRKSQEHPNGAIIEREGPIHLSNVRLVTKAEKDLKKKAKE